MGYSTEFDGALKFNKPITEALMWYINKFAGIRHMKRDNELIKSTFPNWKRLCWHGNLGKDGEYFIGGLGFAGQDEDASVIEYNYPSDTQPALWCQWIITDEGILAWDGGEMFSHYVEWLEYLISNFFEPDGYFLNGEMTYQGDDYDDFGTIHVIDNVVSVQIGVRIQSMQDIETERLIKELQSRGYSVIEKEVNQMPTVEMVMSLLDKNKIRIWQEVGDDSAKCQIGDYWFYFTPIEEDDCLENFSTDELAEMILDCILNAEANGLGDAEAEYYQAVIIEQYYEEETK